VLFTLSIEHILSINVLFCLLHVHSSEDKLLQDEIINILPLVQNVNAMAEEMQKPVAFSIMLVSPEARGLEHGRTEVSLVFHCALLLSCLLCHYNGARGILYLGYPSIHPCLCDHAPEVC